jgi:hypothetical protein
LAVVLHEERLDSSNALDIFAGYDLIVDGTDNFATRYLVNDAAVLLGKPYVWGSIYRFDGQAAVFWAAADGGTAPCYRCLYPEPPPPGMVPSCAEGGVLGVLCASIGAIQVNEAIKLITGIGEPLVGRLKVYDALECDYRDVRIRKDPECVVCGKNPEITLETGLIDYEAFCGSISTEAAEAAKGATISVRDLKAMMDAGEDFFLVDVREPTSSKSSRSPEPRSFPRTASSPVKRSRAATGQAGGVALQERRALGGSACGAQGRRLRRRRSRRRRRRRVGQPDRPLAADVLTPRRADVRRAGARRRRENPSRAGDELRRRGGVSRGRWAAAGRSGDVAQQR